MPGIGKILRLVLLYEIHDIDRFPRVQDFASYAAWSNAARNRAANAWAPRGRKSATPTSSGPFRKPPPCSCATTSQGQKHLARLEKKHDTGKALSILAHKLGRAVYYMLKRKSGIRYGACSSGPKGAERVSLAPNWTPWDEPESSVLGMSVPDCVCERQGAHRPCIPEPCAFDWTPALAPE